MKNLNEEPEDARDAYLETNKIIGFCLTHTNDSYEAMLAASI